MGADKQSLSTSKNRHYVIPRTLVFITNQNDVLLLKGSPRKHIWPNLYNGIGGHVKQGETIHEAALREINEETGLNDVTGLQLRGIITVDVQNPTSDILLFVFTAVSSSREVKPSEEGALEWIDWHKLPPESLVKDLPALLPRTLAMNDNEPPFFARYWYDETDKLQITFTPKEIP